MKKLLSIILALLVVVMMIPAVTLAAEEGVCTDGTVWSLDDDGVLTISGNGAMEDFRAWKLPDANVVKSVVIEDGVTAIERSAFSYCSNLVSVTIPDSVTEIGMDAFMCCYNLENITIPNSVTVIGSSAFSKCTSLKSITIPDSVTIIGSSAFFNCTSLETVTLGSSVVRIDTGAFSECTSLKSITIPEGITIMDYDLFYGCTSLESVVLPDSVTEIGHNTFADCINLKSIDIGDGFTVAADRAFFNCTNLTDIYMSDISALCDITYGKYDSNIMATNSKNKNLYVNGVPVKDLVIPDTVKSIPESAFRYCPSIESVVISESVESVGGSAFRNCTNLKSVVICNNSTVIGRDVFFACNSLEDVFYFGTASDKDALNIIDVDEYFKNAEWHYEVEYAVKDGEYCIYCPDCGEYFKLLHEHEFTHVSNNDATPEADGTKTGICSICGKEDVITDEGSKLKPLSVKVTVMPDKLEYLGNKEELDVTGGKITLYYDRNITRERDLTSEMVSGFDNTVVGKQTLTVTVDGLTTTFGVEIVTATVVFKNYDGSIISSAEYMYGDEIEVPADPEREADNTYTYVFIGWDKEVMNCTGNATYTATFEAEYINYTVVFKTSDGTAISIATYHYGDTIVVPDEPEKPADVDESYIFVGWGRRISTCTGDAVYTAVFSDAIPGDATGDGDVNATDLVRMKKYLAGADVELDESAADVTGDGKVNALDLIRLKKYLSGADVALGQ